MLYVCLYYSPSYYCTSVVEVSVLFNIFITYSVVLVSVLFNIVITVQCCRIVCIIQHCYYCTLLYKCLYYSTLLLLYSIV